MLPISFANVAASTMVNSHPGVLFYNALQCLGICSIYKQEIETPMPYSKFVAEVQQGKESTPPSMIPSKMGMLLIYVPATLMAFLFQLVLPSIIPVSFAATVPGWMLLAHFLKRDAEVLFLHKYSGETQLNTAILIGVSYALTTLMISIVSKPEVSNMMSTVPVKTGLVLFVVGSLGNFYHHFLLAQLRSEASSSGGTKKYSAPTGGLFDFVATPHYLFELVAWLGIALASQQATAYLNLLSMTLYLSARSYNQNQWNKKKFEESEWPTSRKNMIPFLY